MLGRTETRTRDRIYCQTMRTVRDISRDDRARIATCRLRTLTDITVKYRKAKLRWFGHVKRRDQETVSEVIHACSAWEIEKGNTKY